MTITEEQCSKRQKKLADEARKEKHDMFTKLQIYMEKAIDKINTELKNINYSLIVNNTNTQTLLEAHKSNNEQFNKINRWQERATGALTIILLIVLPSSIYLVKDFLNTRHDAITPDQVRTIVIDTIESNYEVQWEK